MDYHDILAFLEWLANWLWGQWQVQTLVGFIVLNVVAAVMAGVSTGNFALVKLAEFLYRKVLPLVGLYGAFAFFGESVDMAWVSDVTWGLLALRLGAELLDNLKKIGVERKVRALAGIPPALTKERLP
jgi:hypothetical protein